MTPDPPSDGHPPQWILDRVTFPERPAVEPVPRAELRESPYGWDRFNGQATNDATAALMEQLGWTRTGGGNGSIVNLTRPGKAAGTSATVGAVAEGVLYVHTSSDPIFDEATPYDAADVYAALHHGGNRPAADRDLTGAYGGSRRFFDPAEDAQRLTDYAEYGETSRKVAIDAGILPDDADNIWDTVSYTIEELGALPELTWAIDGWIPDNSLTVIYGPRKSGKTFTAISMAMHLAEGTHWFGSPCQRQKVAYLAGEGIRGYRSRIAAWTVANQRVPTPSSISFLNATGKNLRDPATLRALIAYLTSGGYTFVFVDTINRLAGGMRENDADGMGEFILAMDEIRAATGATVVPIHHSGKDATQGMRGHSALEGAVDAGILVEKDAEKPLVTVRLRLAREVEEGKTVNLELHTVDGATAPILRPTAEVIDKDKHRSSLKDVVDLLKESNGPVTYERVAVRLGTSERSAKRFVAELDRLGYLTITEGGGRGNPSTFTYSDRGHGL